jgi:CBS domain-containing protein
MKREVARCTEDAFVTEAAEIMRDRDVGFLPVCASNGTVVGIITDRDIAIRVLATGRANEHTRVGDVITTAVVSFHADDELEVAEERMSSFQKSRVVCVDSGGHLAGVISLSAIASLESDGAGIVAASVAGRETTAQGKGLAAVDDGRALECRDVMNHTVECCRREDIASTIAAIMRDREIGFVPICDEAGAIIGTITDRDLTLRVVAARRHALTTRAMDVLTPELVYCAVDDPLSIAEELMTAYKKSRIVCADDARHPQGIISLADIARVEPPGIFSRILRGVASAGARDAI